MKILTLKNTYIYKNQSGFTLLEILVALSLGAGILAAAISMQFQHRKGYTLASNKLVMQTNAKFSFELISKSLLSAGSMGCKNSLQLRGESTINNQGCFGKVCINFNNPSVAFANFIPGFEVLGYEYVGTGLTPSPPNAFTFVLSNQYNADSDMLTVAGGYGEVYRVSEDITPVASQFQLNLMTDSVDAMDVNLEQFQYGMLTSCKGAKVFKVTSSDGAIDSGQIAWAGGTAADDNSSSQIGTGGDTVASGEFREFRRAAVTTFFVGMYPFNTPSGVPTLYQDVDGVTSRLIGGVEEIHFLYGLSEDPIRRNIADRYLTADIIDSESTSRNINLWEQVVSVRIGIIMRSEKEVFDDPEQPVVNLACMGYTQSTKTDRYTRSTYCTEVTIRNRLTGTRVGVKQG